MYWKDTYEFLNSNDIEYKWEGKYGAKGEKRQKKKKATPEQIKKQNQWKKEREVWRKIDVDLEDYYRIKDEQKKNKASE